MPVQARHVAAGPPIAGWAAGQAARTGPADRQSWPVAAGARPSGRRGPTGQRRCFRYGQMGKQRIGLEHHRQVALRRRQRRHVAPGDVTIPERLFKPGDQPKRRRLPAAGRSQQRDKLAGARLEADIVDRTEVAPRFTRFRPLYLTRDSPTLLMQTQTSSSASS